MSKVPDDKKGWKNYVKPELDPRKWFKCLKCDGVFRNNNRIGHCAACCRTFSGSRAFDFHRQGEHGVDRHCADPDTIPDSYKMWIDEKGIWHAGDRLEGEALAKFVDSVSRD